MDTPRLRWVNSIASAMPPASLPRCPRHVRFTTPNSRRSLGSSGPVAMDQLRYAVRNIQVRR